MRWHRLVACWLPLAAGGAVTAWSVTARPGAALVVLGVLLLGFRSAVSRWGGRPVATALVVGAVWLLLSGVYVTAVGLTVLGFVASSVPSRGRLAARPLLALGRRPSAIVPRFVRTRIPTAVRRRVLARDGWRCPCGATRDLTIDHIRPVSRGGTNDEDNLRTLCRSCNSSKGAQVYDEYGRAA